MTSVAAAWTRIDAWLAANAPDVAASLRAGALPPELEAAPELPSELRASLAVHDGQSLEIGLFEHNELMSLEECLRERRGMLELRQTFDAELRESGAEYWGLEWFPFVWNRNGSYLCVDAPTGRVIAFVPNQPDRPLVAESVADLLRCIVDAMEAGECVVDDLGVRLRDPEHPLARALWGS